MPIAVYKAASRADRQHPTLYAAADTVKILAVSEEISLTAACETTRSNIKIVVVWPGQYRSEAFLCDPSVALEKIR